MWGDLSAPNAAWTVRLIDDRGDGRPHRIEAIRKPGAIELTYFPYTSPWRKVFRIRFPKAGAGGSPTISQRAKWLGLRFAGAQGNEDLVWVLGH